MASAGGHWPPPWLHQLHLNCLVTWVSCFWSLPGFPRLWQASKPRWEMHPLSSLAGALGGPQASKVKGPPGAQGRGGTRAYNHPLSGPSPLAPPPLPCSTPSRARHFATKFSTGLRVSSFWDRLCLQSLSPARASGVCEQSPSLPGISLEPWSAGWGRCPCQHRLLSLGVTGSGLSDCFGQEAAELGRAPHKTPLRGLSIGHCVPFMDRD